MSDKFKKGTIVIAIEFIGDSPAIPAYIKEGVAVAKVTRKIYGVHHVGSKKEIYNGLQRSTLREAKVVAQAVLDLDVDWTRSIGDPVFDREFKAAVQGIREIGKGGAV